ncbi:MAG TPA: TauD/TfdA family dioxygenase [Allosphingosinicella sp.]|jgi:alpha-ketoglutarate-dependent taurine dioxygenase|nr:TauD/TfdA family dioxygenase [Allosphingosinicella sp.]
MADIIEPVAGRPYVTVLAERETGPLDIPADTVAGLYRQHGALLLRGFEPDLDGFRLFAERFCVASVFNDSRGRAMLDEKHNIQSVNRGVAPLPLHPELSREPWKPDVCFFGCLSPPSQDGATIVCDGVEIVRHLPAEARRAFEGRRLLYAQPAIPEELEYWLGTAHPSDAQLAAPPAHCPYFFWRAQTMIVRAFTRPALHTPMFCEAPAFGNFLLYARYVFGTKDYPLFEDGSPIPDPLLATVKSIADRLTAPIVWEKGDLLMIDNTRFMHGRTAVRQVEERLIASYFGYLDFAVPNEEEPADPPWRRGTFRPPSRLTAAGQAA